MNSESKNTSNNLQSSINSGIKNSTQQDNLSSKCAACGRAVNSNEKSAGDNEWTSVPMTYDKDDSTKKHEKNETNNQWTSTNK